MRSIIGKAEIAFNRLLVKMWMLTLPERTQEEISNIVLETGRKRGCIMAESLVELCSLVIWKVELGSNELKYLTEETSKPSVEAVAWFLLAS